MFKDEWLFVDEVIKRVYGSQSITFIEVGANDGVRGDHIHYWVSNFNWTGIMIEPLQDECNSLELLYKDRSNIHIENVAVHSSKQSVKLYVPKSEKRRGTASIFRRNRNVHRYRNRSNTIRVPSVTLQSLILKHNIEGLKFLQIDAEGAELEVMKSIDLDVNCPEIINYEHKHIRALGFEKEFLRILRRYRFNAIEYGKRDTVAIRNDIVSKSDFYAMFRNFK